MVFTTKSSDGKILLLLLDMRSIMMDRMTLRLSHSEAEKIIEALRNALQASTGDE